MNSRERFLASPDVQARTGQVVGLDVVLENLDAFADDFEMRVRNAAGEIAALLENYAKTNHGTRPRAAGWVYPGGGRMVQVSNMYHKETGTIGPGEYFQATRRWRPGGTGWGDVTGNLNVSIQAGIAEFSAELVKIVLSAGMEYAVFVELAQSGKWAWLWPAVTANQDNIMKILQARLSV